MMQCSEGTPSDESQQNLRPTFKTNGYFLPCQCTPRTDLTISDINHQSLYSAAYIHKKELLSDTVCKLLIETDKLTDYRPGQFINLSRPADGTARSYSLASNPVDDYFIELHIQRMKEGDISNWIFNELNEHDEIEIQGPNGNCFYQQDKPGLPILMVATGTGLAPVVGILKEALAHNHSENITIYHEVNNVAELYLDTYLKTIEQSHTNVTYLPCIRTNKRINNILSGSAADIINSSYADLSNTVIYLAGSEQMITTVKQIALTKGAPDNHLLSDSFDLKDLRQNQRSACKNVTHSAAGPGEISRLEITEIGYPEPDPEIWKALDQGKKLNKILDEFYTIVYADPKLSPFFQNITKQRSVEKVHLFMRQVFTGEKIFIGDRPRNAHHWMVISNELFDHREDIMMSCLRNNDIPEHIILKWRAIEELFRPDIVKDKPWNKIVNGVELPVDGFEELVLDTGTLCDSCQKPVESGTHVRYHVRLGSVYCPACMNS